MLLQVVMQEYEAFNSTIDNLNEVGNAYDLASRGDAASSPVKRSEL